jgi:hypothetical protein
MSNQPSPQWLTPIIELAQFSGDPGKYFDYLFGIFKRDFIDSHPIFHGKPVLIGDKRIFKGKPECFWHVTSQENKETKEREPNMRRCERVEWIRLIINHCNESAVWVWPKQHEREVRHNLFLERENFLVILVERKTFYLVTAIYVDYPHTRKRLEEEYKRYDDKTKPAQ